MAIDSFHAIIPAGGAGTRLWPLSRQAHPKFLLDLTGSGRSLLQQTWDRLVPLAGLNQITLVTGTSHARSVSEQLPALPDANLLVEPSPRDSMAAIGLAAAIIGLRDPDAVIGSFAADHVIGGSEGFARAVGQAVSAAQHGYVCTIGIEPTGPSTAFGYVESGEVLGIEEAPDARRIAQFVEKPDAATARAYLDTGRFRWNAGMFIARADVLLAHLAEQQPDLAAGITEIASAWDSPARAEVLERVWPDLTKIAIDHAIAEPVAAAGRMAVVPGDFAWDDIGDFAALAKLYPDHEVLGDPALVQMIASSGFVRTHLDRTITVVGVPDVVVIDTPDAVLVTTKAHVQEVKEAVEAWRSAGRSDLL
ncbi:mannose-1-phosphate guanylyltransferase [soil metagenome]